MQYSLKTLISICIATGVLTLTGCNNTIKGAGQDIQHMGNAISSPHKSKPVHHKKNVKNTATKTETTKNTVTTTNMSGFTTTKPVDSTTTTTTSTVTSPTTNQ